MKKISVLGSTGSIGTQTLKVARDLNNIEITAITANSNYRLLAEQVQQFKPKLAVLADYTYKNQFLDLIGKTDTEVLFGQDNIIHAATFDSSEIIVNALVGNMGLLPTVAAIEKGKNIALANKEVLVTAGEIIMGKAKEKNISLIPVDSEHSAIFQCLQGNDLCKIDRIYLTASGGPFLGKSAEQLANVSISDALNHPNWNMGSKITIDSATLMNKGLELIEARWLFGVEPEKITILVHPQSIIHSMVEFEDGAIMAQLGQPDMKVPIQYALTYPHRHKNNYPRVNFFKQNNLTFMPPDMEVFSCLKLAINAIKTGGTLPAVLNAANEIAVYRFLEGEIKFTDIPLLIEMALSAYTSNNKFHNLTLQDIVVADMWSRDYTKNIQLK